MNKITGLKIMTGTALVLAIIVSYLGWQNAQIGKKLNDATNNTRLTLEKNNTLQNNLNEVQKNLQDQVNKLNSITDELEIANQTIADLKGQEYELIYFGNFKITHYCNEPYEHICGYGDGLTATGTKVTPGRTIAVDPKVIPYGTNVYIEGYGWRVAEDCGGSVKDNHIDVAVDMHADAMDMGVKSGGVWILVQKGS